MTIRQPKVLLLCVNKGLCPHPKSSRFAHQPTPPLPDNACENQKLGGEQWTGLLLEGFSRWDLMGSPPPVPLHLYSRPERVTSQVNPPLHCYRPALHGLRHRYSQPHFLGASLTARPSCVVSLTAPTAVLPGSVLPPRVAQSRAIRRAAPPGPAAMTFATSDHSLGPRRCGAASTCGCSTKGQAQPPSADVDFQL